MFILLTIFVVVISNIMMRARVSAGATKTERKAIMKIKLMGTVILLAYVTGVVLTAYINYQS